MSGQRLIRIRDGYDPWDLSARKGNLVARSGRELEDVSAPPLDYDRGRSSYVPGASNAVAPRVYVNKPAKVEKPTLDLAKIVVPPKLDPARPVEPVAAGSAYAGRIVEPEDVLYLPLDLLRAVCVTCGFTRTEMLSESRVSDLAKARHIGFWIMKRFTSRCSPSIARTFGRSDHTTALHGIRRVERVIATLGLTVPDEPIAAIGLLYAVKWPKPEKRPLVVRREVSA